MSDTVEFEPTDLNDLSPEDAFNMLVSQASDMKASDLFLLANEEGVEVSVRHLGIVRPLGKLGPRPGRRLLARIKVVSGIDIDEHRRPLEGRLIHELPDRRIDLRINTIPTMYGEDFTIRLLERDSQLRKLESLGLFNSQVHEAVAMLNSPSGLILVTGPTSSGKTTTLYSALDYLNNGRRKINTIEDPIEYALVGVRQSQVNMKASVDFPDLLRSVLRQAPDVIMVGEIRDSITAKTAVRAANSGHLVLATLHAPVASAAVHSMLAYDVHPYFLSNSLRGVIAQRLVRTLCPDCKQSFDLSEAPETFKEIEKFVDKSRAPALYTATGCKNCGFEGVVNRSGVFEVLNITPKVRSVISQSRPAKEIERAALDEGMIEFRRSGLLKVANGVISTEEMMRVVPAEYLGID